MPVAGRIRQNRKPAIYKGKQNIWIPVLNLPTGINYMRGHIILRFVYLKRKFQAPNSKPDICHCERSNDSHVSFIILSFGIV
jgi:hypothetical protein